MILIRYFSQHITLQKSLLATLLLPNYGRVFLKILPKSIRFKAFAEQLITLCIFGSVTADFGKAIIFDYKTSRQWREFRELYVIPNFNYIIQK